MNKEDLIALFKEKLGGWSYVEPAEEVEDENYLGYINHYPSRNETAFWLLLDENKETIIIQHPFHIGNYDGDYISSDLMMRFIEELKEISDSLLIEYDEEDERLEVKGKIPFSDIYPENINSIISEVTGSIDYFYSELDDKIDEFTFENYELNPILYEDFDCPNCGRYIHIKPDCCPNCGQELQKDEIECPECFSFRDICVCPECSEEITQDSLEDEMKLPEVERQKIAYKRQVLWQLKKREEEMPRDILASEREKNFHLSQEIKGWLPEDFKNILVRVDAQWKNILKVRFRIHKFFEIYILMESDDWENALSPFIGMLPALSKMSGEEEFKKSEEYKKLNDLYLSVR